MTMPPAIMPQKRIDHVVAAARAVVADPENMDTRRDYMRAVFNIDWTAAVIVALAARQSTSEAA